MSPAELEAAADAIAARRADPRTPGVVRRAFTGPGCLLTLRGLMELEEAASPALTGRWPLSDAAALSAALRTAWGILFPGAVLPPPQDLDETLGRIHAEVERGFSTAMPMQFPRTPGAHSAPEPPDGLGWVVRLLARACSGLHMSPDAALDMPLDRLFALTAGLAATEGAHCAGEDYRDRSTAGLLALVPGSDEGIGSGKQEHQAQTAEKEHEEEHEKNIA